MQRFPAQKLCIQQQKKKKGISFTLGHSQVQCLWKGLNAHVSTLSPRIASSKETSVLGDVVGGKVQTGLGSGTESRKAHDFALLFLLPFIPGPGDNELFLISLQDYNGFMSFAALVKTWTVV